MRESHSLSSTFSQNYRMKAQKYGKSSSIKNEDSSFQLIIFIVVSRIVLDKN